MATPADLPRAEKGKAIIISGKTWNLLCDILQAGWLTAGDGVQIKQLTTGRTIHAQGGGGGAANRPWQVTLTETGIYIQVPYCYFPGNSPDWVIDGSPVDFLNPAANALALTGRNAIVLELTVDDTSPLQIYISQVEIKAVDEADVFVQTLTTRRIPICGVDMDEAYVSPSCLSGAIQVRRYGNRNDANNLIWQVT